MFWFSIYRVQCVCFENITFFYPMKIMIKILTLLGKWVWVWFYSKPIYFYGFFIFRNHTHPITQPNPFFGFLGWVWPGFLGWPNPWTTTKFMHINVDKMNNNKIWKNLSPFFETLAVATFILIDLLKRGGLWSILTLSGLFFFLFS